MVELDGASAAADVDLLRPIGRRGREGERLSFLSFLLLLLLLLLLLVDGLLGFGGLLGLGLRSRCLGGHVEALLGNSRRGCYCGKRTVAVADEGGSSGCASGGVDESI